jgi:NAD(P) transhydrogenase subunit alpha
MRIAIPREVTPREARVAITPDAVARLVAKHFQVSVETGAGVGACCDDAAYEAAGARIEPIPAALWQAGDLIVKIRPPTDEEIALMRPGSAIVSLLYPLVDVDRVRTLADRGVTALAADMVPRTTAAQMMDVLSSQATVAGYRAVLVAAEASPRLFPLLMTAAGTISPARVLVLGAGVAGLQAIATARRLGATVEAFDVRRIAREQVESLGARFIEVPQSEDAQTAGGYAKEVSERDRAAQATLLLAAVGRADAVITTALIPGKRAPVLVTDEMVRAMKPGSVIIDLAAEMGGNCTMTRAGQRRRTDDGVLIVGDTNLASQVSIHASQMYARNMERLIAHVTRERELALDPSDEIMRGMTVVHDGRVVLEALASITTKAAA